MEWLFCVMTSNSTEWSSGCQQEMQVDRLVQMAALKRDGQLALHLHSLCQAGGSNVFPLNFEKGYEMQLLSSCWTGVVPSSSILSALAIQKESLLAPPVVMISCANSCGEHLACHCRSARKAEGSHWGLKGILWYPKAATIYPINFIYPNNQASKGQGHGFWRAQLLQMHSENTVY